MANTILEEIRECIIRGEHGRIARVCEEALAQGISADDIIIHGMNEGLKAVGQKYEEGVYFLPNLVLAGEAAKAGMSVLEPRLASEDVKRRGIIVAASVTGDVHDIGKNIVVAMLRGGGFQVVDLGVNVASDTLLETAVEIKADIVAASATLSTTLPGLRDVVDLVHDSAPEGMKVLIGGAATTEKFSRDIGADGWAPNAPGAVKAADRLMRGKVPS
jgi:5-methyltetrahydrofolate--homocysteine methyltransferase